MIFWSIFFLNIRLLLAATDLRSYQYGDGMITVLEASVFQKPDAKTKVIKHYRKGDIVRIHPQHFAKGPVDKNYENLDQFLSERDKLDLFYETKTEETEVKLDQEFSQDLSNKSENTDHPDDFYKTLDDIGQTAYIPKRFVKLIYKDEREYLTNVNPYLKDPTDYRIPEPIPKTYPIYNIDQYKFWFSTGLGTQAKQKYPYADLIQEESFGNRYEFKFTFLSKIHHHYEERMYFGVTSSFDYFENEFQIFIPLRSRVSTETRSRFGVGPYISYDTLRFDPFQITLYQGFYFYLYNRHNIVQKLEEGTRESRTFTGKSLATSSGILLQRRRFISENVDLLFGSSLQLEIPHTLRAQDKIGSLNQLWNRSELDHINYSMTAHISWFLGLQVAL